MNACKKCVFVEPMCRSTEGWPTSTPFIVRYALIKGAFKPFRKWMSTTWYFIKSHSRVFKAASVKS